MLRYINGQCIDLFRTLCNIYDGAFWKNTSSLSNINYCRKKDLS